jgi:hypothetical protein
LWTVCLGWLWTSILLLSASWVTRITGVRHRHQAWGPILREWIMTLVVFCLTVARCVLTHNTYQGREVLGQITIPGPGEVATPIIPVLGGWGKRISSSRTTCLRKKKKLIPSSVLLGKARSFSTVHMRFQILPITLVIVCLFVTLLFY